MDKESQHIIDRSREFRSALLGHSLSEDDAREIYDTCFKSLPLFNFTFLSDDFREKYGCPSFHREIADKLLNKSVSHLVVTAPRGFSKSTLISLGFAAHQAVYKQQRFIVLCSSTELIALDWTSKLKGNFEDNELLLRAFGHLRTRKVYDGTGTDKWTTKEFVLRHPDNFSVRFRSRGAGQSIQGSNPREGRPSIFICHAKDTLIWERGRLIKIQESRYAKSSYEAKTVKIRVTGIPISEYTTREHLFWARKKVRWYDKNRKSYWEFEDPQWVEACDLTRDHYIGSPINYQDSELRPIKVFKNRIGRKEYVREIPKIFYDKEWWWAFGLWLGDGSLNKSRTNKTKITWYCADKYPEIKRRLVDFLSRYRKVTRVQRVGCEQILVSYADLSKWLLKSYIDKAIKVAPAWVYKLPVEYLREIIRGYIDSDGWVKNAEPGPCVRITSINLEGLLLIQKALAKLGIPSYIREGAGSRVEKFPNGYTSVSKQKYDIYFRDNVEQLGLTIRPSTRYSFNRVFIDNGAIWKKVISVEDCGNKEIYPIKTPAHVYSTPIGLSHNCDDIESDKNTNTLELRFANKKWLNSTVLPALISEGGRIVVDGNLIHSGGLINSLPDSPRWMPLFYQAIDDQGNSIWEEKFPLERLEEIKADYAARGDLNSFFRMWMNVAVGDEERTFKLTEENYHKAYRSNGVLKIGEDQELPYYIFIGLDPGGWGSIKRDFTTIVVVALVPGGTAYVLEYFQGRTDPTATIDKLFEICRRYTKPSAVGVETTAYQEALAFYVKQRMREEGYYFVVRELKPRTAKSERLMSLQPRFQTGSLKIRRGMSELEEELFGFPRGRHDDLLDGLYNALEISYPPSATMKPQSQDSGSKDREEQRSWLVL